MLASGFKTPFADSLCLGDTMYLGFVENYFWGSEAAYIIGHNATLGVLLWLRVSGMKLLQIYFFVCNAYRSQLSWPFNCILWNSSQNGNPGDINIVHRRIQCDVQLFPREKTGWNIEDLWIYVFSDFWYGWA